MRREHEVGGGGSDDTSARGQGGEELIDQMIEALLREADTPPREVEGVNEEFCDCTSCSYQFLIPFSSFYFLKYRN
jgi:hypothetical protein